MDNPPKRRWFHFRLSTILILTTIAAWAMACRPLVRWFVILDPKTHIVRDYWQFNENLIWPTGALILFLAWKADRFFARSG